MPIPRKDYALYAKLLGALIAIKDKHTVWALLLTLITSLLILAFMLWIYLHYGPLAQEN